MASRKHIYLLTIVLMAMSALFMTLQTAHDSTSTPLPIGIKSYTGPFVKKQYPISQSCKIRQNRVNPRQNPDRFKCPVDTSWGENLGSYTAPGKYSFHTRTPQMHTMYENVCVDGSRSLVQFYVPETQRGTLNINQFGWPAYRTNARKSFSWHYNIQLLNQAPPAQAKWVNGTSIWFDQSYGNICHTGHGTEFFTKLVELRHQFPGPIERIIYAKDQEFKGRADAYQFCHVTCNLFRLGFEKEGFQFPKIFWWEQQPESKQPLCFEKLLVPSNHEQHFTSREAGLLHKNAAYHMCGIEPKYDTRKEPKNILFFQRGFDRQIYNAEALCEEFQSEGFNAYLETFEDIEDFCLQVATIYSADIIISVHGSHNHLLSYARPGSVVVIVDPLGIRLPDWKLLAYFSSLRILELQTLNGSYHREHEGFPVREPNITVLAESTLKCMGKWPCRMTLRHSDVYVPWENLEMFVRHAVTIWNVDSPEPCEKPLPWPVPIPNPPPASLWIWDGGWPNNWNVCEPPYPNCICCKVPECVQETSLERGW